MKTQEKFTIPGIQESINQWSSVLRDGGFLVEVKITYFERFLGFTSRIVYGVFSPIFRFLASIVFAVYFSFLDAIQEAKENR